MKKFTLVVAIIATILTSCSSQRATEVDELRDRVNYLTEKLQAYQRYRIATENLLDSIEPTISDVLYDGGDLGAAYLDANNFISIRNTKGNLDYELDKVGDNK